MEKKDIQFIPFAKYLVIDLNDNNLIIMPVIHIKEKNGVMYLVGRVHCNEHINILDRKDHYVGCIDISKIKSYRLFEEREKGLLINWSWMSETFKRDIFGK